MYSGPVVQEVHYRSGRVLRKEFHVVSHLMY